MKRKTPLWCATLVAVALGAIHIVPTSISIPTANAVTPVSVIVDLDIEADVDDVGALALLHALADNGEANILGVTVDTSSQWGPPAVDAINTYHGRPNIPIGQYKGPAFDPVGPANNFPQTIATEFPQDIGSGGNAENAVTLLRRLLASQPDDSVVIVGIGFLNNLKDLLNSGADAYSPLSGMALVDLKVKALSVMGGYYPSGVDGFNWWYDKLSAGRVINDWPGRIIFSGLGASVGTGPALATQTPVTNPSRRAYALFPGANNNRPSWDQISTLVAVRGNGSLFGEVTGSNSYNVSSGANTFVTSVNDGHTYLTQSVSDSTLASVISNLMVQAPASTAIGNGVYRLTAKHSNKVLEVASCSASGAVQQNTWANTNCQKWRVTAVGGGYYRVEAVATGKVLDVWNLSTANGGSVVQHQWLNGANQLWAFGPTGDGRFQIVNKNSSKGLDVPYISTADGVAVWQYQWLGGDNQKWQLGYLTP